MTLDLTALKAKAAEPAELVIEEGKYYPTRNGQTVGPIGRNDNEIYPWRGKVSGCGRGSVTWTAEGRYWEQMPSAFDLVAEQPPEPTRADLRVLIAEVERLRETLEWQPIETAPRDAENILLFWPLDHLDSASFKRIKIGWWSETQRGWVWQDRAFRTYSSEPTHWMPLPPPPSPETKDAGR